MSSISTISADSNSNEKGPVFHIDPSYSDHSIDSFPLSARAQDVLKFIGVKKLRDLHGVPHRKIVESSANESEVHREIMQFSEIFKYPTKTSETSKKPSPEKSDQDLISVPQEGFDWDIRTLPFPIRLIHALERLNCKRLGDLHHVSYNTFMEMPNCGARTVKRLRKFIDRVHKKEFGVSHEYTGESRVAFLLSKIDAFLEEVPGHRRTIFMERVGAQKGPMTLASVGLKYDITRERVRQIVDLYVREMRRFGGPPFTQALQDITKELEQNMWILTPQLLEELSTPCKTRPQYSPAFYIRLLGWLSPGISAWPVGQTPVAYRIPEQDKIVSRLKEWFWSRVLPVKIMDAYQGINTGDFRCTPLEFMEALRFASEFEIDMREPKDVLINPPIRFPRHWARRLLSGANASAASREMISRAKAILGARRSHTSKYRLASGPKEE